MGFLRDMLDPLGITQETPQAEASQAEIANAQMLRAMRDSWNETGIPAQRERIARTLGVRYNPATKTYDADPTARRARFDADGNIKTNMADSGDAVATISGAYEKHRGNYNPDANTKTAEMGDIEQAKDESMAQRQTIEADTTDALGAMSNAAGMAHGAQMQSAADMSQLSANQAQTANFNAASRFASDTNRRSAIASAAGLGAAMHGNMQQPSIKDRLGTRRLHGAGR